MLARQPAPGRLRQRRERPTAMQASGPTRRSAIVSVLALAAGSSAACDSSSRPDPAPAPAPSSTANPDDAVMARVVAAERSLLERYAAALARHPSLADRLRPLREEHVAHLAALGASRTPGTPTPTAPAAPAAALVALASAERAAAAARVDDVVATASPALARLLAGIGGCEAGHAALLGRR